jgi:hypothetical protein
MKAIFFKKNNIFQNQDHIANFIEKIGNLFENWYFDTGIVHKNLFSLIRVKSVKSVFHIEIKLAHRLDELDGNGRPYGCYGFSLFLAINIFYEQDLYFDTCIEQSRKKLCKRKPKKAET